MEKKGKIIMAAGAGAAAVALGVLALTLGRGRDTVPTPNEIIMTTTEAPTEISYEIPSDWEEKYGYVPSEEGYTPRTMSLLRYNKDIAGWLSLDNTVIHNPIVLDPGDIKAGDPFYGPAGYGSNEYYLDHDLYRNQVFYGTVFADYRNVFGSDESEHTENLILYGHAMYDGTMMGDLRKYHLNSAFYGSNAFIKVSSNYRDYDYVIFSYLVTPGNYDDTDFHYWNMEQIDNEEDFNFYIDQCRKKQMLDTGVDMRFGDKLLTLSTCYNDDDNTRFIVVARLLREGEVAGDLSTVQHTEAYNKAHEEKPAE